jgi:integrase
MEILEGVPRITACRFIFSTTGKTPVSGFSKVKKQLDEIIAKNRKEKGIKAKMPSFRLHDLRRTVSTGMNGLGVLPHIVEQVLNHQSGTRGGVAGVYNRFAYLEEKRAALRAWADHVRGVVQ